MLQQCTYQTKAQHYHRQASARRIASLFGQAVAQVIQEQKPAPLIRQSVLYKTIANHVRVFEDELRDIECNARNKNKVRTPRAQKQYIRQVDRDLAQTAMTAWHLLTELDPRADYGRLNDADESLIEPAKAAIARLRADGYLTAQECKDAAGYFPRTAAGLTRIECLHLSAIRTFEHWRDLASYDARNLVEATTPLSRKRRQRALDDSLHLCAVNARDMLRTECELSGHADPLQLAWIDGAEDRLVIEAADQLLILIKPKHDD